MTANAQQDFSEMRMVQLHLYHKKIVLKDGDESLQRKNCQCTSYLVGSIFFISTDLMSPRKSFLLLRMCPYMYLCAL